MNMLAKFTGWGTARAVAAPVDVRADDETPRPALPAVGLFALLSAEQKKRVLAFDGPEHRFERT